MQPRKPRTVAEVRDLLRSKGGLETSALAVSPAQVLSDRLRSLGIVPGQRPPVDVALDTLRCAADASPVGPLYISTLSTRS
jgi:hypothetical protein